MSKKQTNLEKVYDVFQNSQGGVLTTKELMEKTGLPRSSVSYACTLLMAGGKIERYLTQTGLFKLKPEEKKTP